MKNLFGFGSSDPKKKANDYIIKGNWAKALIEYKKIVEADPANIRNRQKLGDIYCKLNQIEEAIEEYTEVADSYAKEGFLIKAIAINKLIMKLDPENVDVQESLASLYTSRGISYKSHHKVVEKEEEKKAEVVPKIPLFSNLSHEEFCNVVNKLKERNFQEGEIICNEGDEGNSIFVISEGEVTIHRKNSQGQHVELANLTDGAFFGEFAFFSRSKRHATVSAKKDTLIFEITKDDIEEIINEFPRVNKVLFDFYKERVILNLLAMSPIFEPCTIEERKTLMDRFEQKNYDIDGDIIKEGDAGDSIFLIKSGNVRVTIIKGGKVLELARLQAGEFFGEIALVTGQPRTATVSAVTQSEVLELKKADFDEITGSHPEIKGIIQAYLQDRAKKTVSAVINFGKENRAKNKMV